MPRRGENIRKRKDGRWEGRYKQRSDIAEEIIAINNTYKNEFSNVEKAMAKP